VRTLVDRPCAALRMALAVRNKRQVRATILHAGREHETERASRGWLFRNRDVDLEQTRQPGSVIANVVAADQLAKSESIALQPMPLTLCGCTRGRAGPESLHLLRPDLGRNLDLDSPDVAT